MEKIRAEVLVVGGGVIGLACARALSLAGKEVVLIERGKYLCNETSSRNSSVIHSGVYYKKNSLKARLCVEGKAMLFDLAQQKRVELNKCGKLIVATSPAEVPKLQNLLVQGQVNSAGRLFLLNSIETSKLEPSVLCEQSLLCESTSVLNSQSYFDFLINECRQAGVIICTQCAMKSASYSEFISSRGNPLLEVNTTDGVVECNYLINCSGHVAPSLARQIVPYPRHLIPPTYFAKGTYFKLVGREQPFSRLVYPLPSPGGLGIHATIDMSGHVRFGPNVEWLKECKFRSANPIGSFVDHEFEFCGGPGEGAYQVNDTSREEFVLEIQKYWPGVVDSHLEPDYSGIRPKLVGPSGTQVVSPHDLSDFVIESQSTHRVTGLINLFGIESPGLTSSLAIAKLVSDLVVHDH